MSGRPSSSRGGSNAGRGGSRMSDLASAAGPSSHRFAERRQERMRGAGTAVAMHRDFQFKLPQKRSAPSVGSANDSISTDGSISRRGPGRPRGSGPKQRAAAAAAAAAAADGSFDAFSPPPLGDDDGTPYSSRMDASGSMGVPRRVARTPTGPVSSTPAALRVQKQPYAAGSARRGEDEEELGSQLGEDYSGSSASASAGSAPILGASPDFYAVLDPELDPVDESLPMIPSPVASSSHVDTSIRRMRPSIGGTSASHLSIASQGDSSAARAAQRNLDARQRRRQGSPGSERIRKQAAATAAAAAASAKRRGRPPKAAASTSAAPRVLVRVPTENEDDETVMNRTMVERQRGTTATARGARPGREMQKRLKRALSLVFSEADPVDPDSSQPSKKRKSAKYLNDVDIIWSIVDEELRSAIEEQPAKAPFVALKALRKSVRSNFLNLSEKTDNRTTLISQLLRARKQKRLLRKEVFVKRSELAKVTVEAGEREKEMKDWKKEVGDVRKCNAFLLNLRDQAAAWT